MFDFDYVHIAKSVNAADRICINLAAFMNDIYKSITFRINKFKLPHTVSIASINSACAAVSTARNLTKTDFDASFNALRGTSNDMKALNTWYRLTLSAMSGTQSTWRHVSTMVKNAETMLQVLDDVNSAMLNKSDDAIVKESVEVTTRISQGCKTFIKELKKYTRKVRASEDDCLNEIAYIYITSSDNIRGVPVAA